MKKYYTTANQKLVILAFVLGLSLPLAGQSLNSLQNVPADEGLSDLIAKQTLYLKKEYAGKAETPEDLINGKEYESYYIRSVVKPLLFPDRKRTASILAQTRKYLNLNLQYDTFTDEVIYTDTTKMLNYRFPQVALNKDKVDGFSLYFTDDSMIFRYLRMPECAAMRLKEGFYEVAYEGKTRFFIKHQSLFYEREGVYNYKYSPVRYINTGSGFFPAKSRKDLLRLTGQHSKEVKKYIHANGIRMRQATRDQVTTVLRYCDSLDR
jgi:hypothetical protein